MKRKRMNKYNEKESIKYFYKFEAFSWGVRSFVRFGCKVEKLAMFLARNRMSVFGSFPVGETNLYYLTLKIQFELLRLGYSSAGKSVPENVLKNVEICDALLNGEKANIIPKVLPKLFTHNNPEFLNTVWDYSNNKPKTVSRRKRK